ncbi:MAG: tetratricopeptide repeat protein [Verrucomicrobia bacterium]|nr:tetratricopeptide repeat protein [Verrucomicrobiota bacterium]
MAYHASIHLRRANLLLAQGRYADAEAFFRQALAEDADDPQVLGRFSLCLGCLGKNKEGLEALDRALLRTPDVAVLHSQKALLLADEQRFALAKKSAEEAMRLDPDLALAYAARSEISAGLHEWKEAEAQARRALQREAGNLLAQNVLSHALLMQGKEDENDANLAARLAEDAEDPYTHCNVGRAALRRGDAKAAQQHFKIALGLDPTIDEAREGLLDAFRLPSRLDQWFLAFSFFVAKFSNKARLWLVLGVLLGYQLLYQVFAQVAPVIGLGLALFYFLFVLWSFVGRGLGTLIILADRSARNALNPSELREGLVGGGSLAAGFCIAMAGMISKKMDLALFGCAMAGCSMPLAAVFRNLHPKGNLIYPAIAAMAVTATVVLFVEVVAPEWFHPTVTALSPIVVAITVAVTSWFVNLGVCFESR